jgi:hypothetical protein
MRLRTLLRLVLVIIVALPLLVRSNLAPANQDEQVRTYTRSIEFDYVSWILDALWMKVSQGVLGAGRYLPVASQHSLVLEYLTLVKQQSQTEDQISSIYTDPGVRSPEIKSASLRTDLRSIQTRLNQIGPLAESILQSQVSQILARDSLSAGGEILPPVWYHVSSLPLALIVSPRDQIRSDVDVSLLPDLSLSQVIDLENQVSRARNVSALVVPVGGIGIYPTMVMRTDDLTWLSSVISHEWTHNYLTLRPLGLSYDASPELRTMNETTASIIGSEVGAQLISTFYPELAPKLPAPIKTGIQTVALIASAPTGFNFRAEMRLTRAQVDALLAQGKIDAAENYMEAQRRVFFANGYPIRKLNQAYFAFYGAYADQPGGAAGEDPVGPAVRLLRQKSPSLAAFLNRISWMTSLSQLQQADR